MIKTTSLYNKLKPLHCIINYQNISYHLDFLHPMFTQKNHDIQHLVRKIDGRIFLSSFPTKICFPHLSLTYVYVRIYVFTYIYIHTHGVYIIYDFQNSAIFLVSCVSQSDLRSLQFHIDQSHQISRWCEIYMDYIRNMSCYLSFCAIDMWIYKSSTKSSDHLEIWDNWSI